MNLAHVFLCAQTRIYVTQPQRSDLISNPIVEVATETTTCWALWVSWHPLNGCLELFRQLIWYFEHLDNKSVHIKTTAIILQFHFFLIYKVSFYWSRNIDNSLWICFQSSVFRRLVFLKYKHEFCQFLTSLLVIWYVSHIPPLPS